MKTIVHTFSFVALLLCTANFTNGVRADIKIKTRMEGGTESTTYIKGKRQRMETGSEIAVVTQCDMKRSLQLNARTKTYTVTLFNQSEAAAATTDAKADATNQMPAKRGGIITSTITAKDTGERQQMFGFTARRIKTSMVTEPSPDACSQTKSRIDSDGWYIDLALEFNCENQQASAMMASVARSGCQDQYHTKQIGAAKLGYPVKVTMTMYDDNNRPSNTYSYEVVELSKATLDQALFDLPAGYREVKDLQEMFGASAEMSADNDDEAATTNRANNSLNTTRRDSADNLPRTPATVSAKKEGVIRIGVAMTKTTAAGEGVDATTLSHAVRNTMVNYLTAPAIEIIPLDARLPVQVDAEAKQKECDYTVYTVVAHRKGKSGGFGSFLKAAAPVASAIPTYGSTAGAVAAGVATTTIYTAANVASSVKAKDELTLEYSLQNAGGSSLVSNILKAKARTDGDDLISQLVEQAATAILAQATKK